MFKNVLVGVDGQQGGRDAVALAKQLLVRGGRLTLANVYLGEAYIWRGASAEYRAAQRQDALALLEWARAAGGIAADIRSIAAQSVGRGLHGLAEDLGADLLVVGSSTRGPLGRVLLGDDTRMALTGAPCAVAIAPVAYAEQGPAVMREIGVAYNGSAESQHALAIARELAANHGTRLSAFEAVSLPASVFIGGPAPVHESVEGAVREARDRLDRLGGVEAHAAYGLAAEELTLYSASLDLLVVGSRDYGPVGRLIHGSTACQLARTARCPLLVLTRASRAARHGPAPTPPAAPVAA